MILPASDKKKERTPLEWLILIGIVGLVILIGLFTLNQFLSYTYKVELLLDPCGLCEQLNKNTKCITQRPIGDLLYNITTIP